jgi:Lrp/AsnC family transcriptional regulator, leucine-responsive regulatory protein
LPLSISREKQISYRVVIGKPSHACRLAFVQRPPTPELSPELADAAPVAVDDTDLAILELLVTDARASQRRIAREVGMSPPAVAERIARLERLGLIRGYRAEIDRARLGFPLVVYVSVVAVTTLKHPYEVLNALRALPEVEDVAIVAGPMDLILRLRVRDQEHLRRCLFEKIWKLPGVNRTETFLALSPAEAKSLDLDLIRMLKTANEDGGGAE